MKPILFSTEMVQAILEGRKTQTRRIIKPQTDENGVGFMKNPPLDWESTYKETWCPWKWDTVEGERVSKFCPYGDIGDILWVRETWQKIITPFGKDAFVYKADDDFYKDTIEDWPGWSPSIFMPKEACRLFLKITSIRVERLQGISEQDAIAEGVRKYENRIIQTKYKDYVNARPTSSAVESFETLWQSVYGRESWDANPWVWVIEFERIEKP